MTKLAVSDKAPAFTLKDQNGKAVKLSGAKGHRVVVYFYPKADTPGCTQQSCSLRDAFPQLKKLNAVVFGISPDPVEKQKKFDDKYGLGFPLLADTDHAVAEAFGVWGEKALYVESLRASLPLFSPDGMISRQAAESVLSVLKLSDPDVANAAAIDLGATYTNRFVEEASRSID